jgi:predicted ATPase/class 3 adenylate cyclase
MIPGYEIGKTIHRSTYRSIYQAVRLRDGAPVAIKTLHAEYPSRQHVAQLRREFRILDQLRPVEPVIQAYAIESYGNGNAALVLESFGRSLADRLTAEADRKLPLPRFFSIAIGLAKALAEVHAHDLVYKNVEPRSVLLDDTGALRLIDFSMASELSQELQTYALSKQVEGALPYMAPEQTGRMNRDVDYRSDYYSLGVTLFQLLTGRLPFNAESVLEWVHNHISKQPPSPSDIDKEIPEVLSRIVLKLMAKNAEERYQSSYGLIEDLSRSERELVQSGSIRLFDLGRRDVSRTFQMPQRLYGREAELAALLAVFERAAAGAAEFCMVSGHSGIGKSALVNELSKTLVRHRGYLIQGKFDQFQRGTPYSAVAVAFRSLVRQLLVESDERQEALRQKLQASVGANGRILLELIPELQLIIGAQPAVSELPPAEAQNRFQLVFLSFVRAITEEQPLVIFFDDLQFGDSSTLNLIRWLAAARDLKHLLVIGAYRSNEVDVGHPLRLALNEIEQSHGVHDLLLHPLELDATEQLVADVLHTDRASCRDLALLLHEKAEGNPFFLTEMLKTLEQARVIVFVPDAGRWRWDIEAARRSELGGNVVHFVVANLRKLPRPTQQVLQLAACIGNSFDLRTLSIIYERSLDETAEDLLPALRRHIVIPLNDDYKLVGKVGAGGPARHVDDESPNPLYRFQHDRIQQAGYALIDAARKQAVHLSIGRLIQRHATAAEREERLIEIVGHLNEGRLLITDPDELRALARLNLAAGRRAQRSSAHEAALAYLGIGQELLPPEPWTADYELTMELAAEYQQGAYLTARYDEAEIWMERMLEQARTDLEKAEILSTRTRQYSTTGKMEGSIQAAIMGLSMLGIRITENPGPAAIGRERAAVKRNLAGRKIADLVAAPPMADRTRLLAVRLLMEIFPAAFLSGSGNLFPFLVLKSVNLSLRYGNSPESAFAYAAYGMLLCGALDDPATGYEFGKLAVAMNDKLDDIALKSRVMYVYTMFVLHWNEHWSNMTPWFRRGIESGYQSGDLLYLAYSAQDCVIWDPRLDLETAAQEHADLLTIVRDCAYQDSFDSGSLFLQMQRNFLGLTESLCSMNDASFNEDRCVEGMRRRGFMTGIANYHIYKAEICFLYGEHGQALEHVRKQDQLVASSMSLPQLVRFYLVAFLTLAACYGNMEDDEKATTRRRLRRDLRRMSRWAANCPDNFLHLTLLMQAELARLDGRVERASLQYNQAIDAAHASGFRRDEAMANELAGRHLLAARGRKAAEGYLHAACNHYEQWGARRKVEHLEGEFPHLRQEPMARPRRPTGPAATPNTVDSASLDMASVMKASQAISSEIVLDQLWRITMRIMLENAGGQRGCFVVREDGQFVVQGLTDISDDSKAAARSLPLDGPEGAQAVPISIVYRVLRTNTPVVVHDATASGEFARDQYILTRKPRSVLCIPLVRHGKFEGAIYMENGLATGAFTEDRIEVIKLLAAQVSISIENARLYADQARLIEAQQRFVPSQFLESLDHKDIASVGLGEYVAKRMTVVFADLRGFTALSERLEPRRIIELLNRYFTAMEAEIRSAGGFIDSFSGDEIMALFDGSADAAVRAGVGMWRALDEFNRRSAALGQPELQIGIGVNTGPVVLGTVGGISRIQCTVIGDTVNLASRIEQLTKTYSTRFLIGEHAFQSLKDPAAFPMRLVDRVAVVGKTAPIDLYEVIDAEAPERRQAKMATAGLMQSAMRKYFDRDFAGAHAEFEAMGRQDPLDPLPKLFAERSARYLQRAHSKKWQGFEKLDLKQ